MTDIEIANPSRAAIDVIRERFRQISEEGWSAEHDDQHILGEMALAAAAYAGFSSATADRSLTVANRAFDLWPWQSAWWKPTDRHRSLVKAGALIIAEIERLDRQAARRNSPEATS